MPSELEKAVADRQREGKRRAKNRIKSLKKRERLREKKRVQRLEKASQRKTDAVAPILPPGIVRQLQQDPSSNIAGFPHTPAPADGEMQEDKPVCAPNEEVPPMPHTLVDTDSFVPRFGDNISSGMVLTSIKDDLFTDTAGKTTRTSVKSKTALTSPHFPPTTANTGPTNAIRLQSYDTPIRPRGGDPHSVLKRRQTRSTVAAKSQPSSNLAPHQAHTMAPLLSQSSTSSSGNHNITPTRRLTNDTASARRTARNRASGRDAPIFPTSAPNRRNGTPEISIPASLTTQPQSHNPSRVSVRLEFAADPDRRTELCQPKPPERTIYDLMPPIIPEGQYPITLNNLAIVGTEGRANVATDHGHKIETPAERAERKRKRRNFHDTVKGTIASVGDVGVSASRRAAAPPIAPLVAMTSNKPVGCSAPGSAVAAPAVSVQSAVAATAAITSTILAPATEPAVIESTAHAAIVAQQAAQSSVAKDATPEPAAAPIVQVVIPSLSPGRARDYVFIPDNDIPAPSALEAAMAELRAGTMSSRAAATKHGIARNVLRRALEQAGLVFHRRTRRYVNRSAPEDMEWLDEALDAMNAEAEEMGGLATAGGINGPSAVPGDAQNCEEQGMAPLGQPSAVDEEIEVDHEVSELQTATMAQYLREQDLAAQAEAEPELESASEEASPETADTEEEDTIPVKKSHRNVAMASEPEGQPTLAEESTPVITSPDEPSHEPTLAEACAALALAQAEIEAARSRIDEVARVAKAEAQAVIDVAEDKLLVAQRQLAAAIAEDRAAREKDLAAQKQVAAPVAESQAEREVVPVPVEEDAGNSSSSGSSCGTILPSPVKRRRIAAAHGGQSAGIIAVRQRQDTGSNAALPGVGRGVGRGAGRRVMNTTPGVRVVGRGAPPAAPSGVQSVIARRQTISVTVADGRGRGRGRQQVVTPVAPAPSLPAPTSTRCSARRRQPVTKSPPRRSIHHSSTQGGSLVSDDCGDGDGDYGDDELPERDRAQHSRSAPTTWPKTARVIDLTTPAPLPMAPPASAPVQRRRAILPGDRPAASQPNRIGTPATVPAHSGHPATPMFGTRKRTAVSYAESGMPSDDDASVYRTPKPVAKRGRYRR